MINGVATFAHNLASGLAERGHEVLVLAPSITGEFSIAEDPEHNFKTARLSSLSLPIYPDQIHVVPEDKSLLGLKIPTFWYKNGLRVCYKAYSESVKVLDDFGPDLIHNQTPGPVALAILRYAKLRQVPLVSTDHAYPDNLTQQARLPKIIKRPMNKMMNRYFISFLKKSQYATMPSEQAVRDLIPKNKKRFKVAVEALSNGIDLSRFKPGKVDPKIYQKYQLPKKQPIVLYVGRVDPEKSLDVLVMAFAKLAKLNPEPVLVIVGDGTARAKLEQLAQKLNIDKRCHFLGRVTGADLPQIYRSATVFAISSKTETQSIVLMEAMATGKPCVAVKAGAIPALIANGKNGFLCKPDDPKALATAILKIIENETLANQMGQVALEKIKPHDLDYTLSRLEDIYQNVIERYKIEAPFKRLF